MPAATAATTPPRAGAAGPLDAWLTVVGTPDPVLRSVMRDLEQLGVRLRPRGAAPDGVVRRCPGVVAFAGVGPAVLDCIRLVADGGRVRVLALATRRPSDEESWDLLRAGAADVVPCADPARAAPHVAARLRRWTTVEDLLDCHHVQAHLIGNSPAWRAVLREAVEAARFTDAPVLVTGETGTGKERIAQLVHELGDPRRARKQLVVVDCSTIVPSLSGSEFFGHEKGAFTGASTVREGAFELADGGTLFLDEVGELPAPLQAELLRVVQEGTFKRVGANTWRTSRFRLVCATNRDLELEQTRGAFRSDLFHRIAGCRLHLPCLEDRREDVVPLFRHFFAQAAPDAPQPVLEDAVRDLLQQRPYPGNVRELRSLALRIAHRHVGDGVVTVGDVPDDERPGRHRPTARTDPRLAECIRRALELGVSVQDVTTLVIETASRLARVPQDGHAGVANAPSG
jgi:transcriptional regulator with GAF, ATPase, and Fis domain